MTPFNLLVMGVIVVALAFQTLVVFLSLIPVLMLTVPNVYASGLSVCNDPEPTEETCRDFINHPEAYCLNYDNDPKCTQMDICDDEGDVTSEDLYCTGGAIPNLPYPPGGCPEGYHSLEDDESGLCYDNELGCEYDELIFNEDRTACVEYKIDCDLNEDHKLCNGVERTDGIKVCDLPDHPGYKFCNGDD